MEKSIQLLPFILFLILLPLESNAQKIAYIDLEEFMYSLAEVKEAQRSLESLQRKLQEEGQNLVSEYQEKVISLQQKEKLGELSPKQLEKETMDLGKEQQKLVEFEKNMISQINSKSEELFRPIKEKILDAIKQIAKEKGYAYVFNSQANTHFGGVLPIRDERDNIELLLKEKLGIN